MVGTQKVNDKCNCKSGKKYKKCCMNIPQNTQKTHKQSDAMMEMLDYIHMQMPYANIPHCKICGDTEDKGPLKKCDLIGGGIALFCNTCFRCQMSM
jgi:hypothetical protein